MELSSEQVKQLLLPYDQETIRNILLNRNLVADERSMRIVTLGYMCARGMINDVVAFLHELGNAAPDIINAPHHLFYNGTVLHMALYFNAGDIGHQLFLLLRSHGALYYTDYYGLFPWEQLSIDEGNLDWIHPLENTVLGDRSNTEFTIFYNQLRNTYDLGLVEEEEEVNGVIHHQGMILHENNNVPNEIQNILIHYENEIQYDSEPAG